MAQCICGWTGAYFDQHHEETRQDDLCHIETSPLMMGRHTMGYQVYVKCDHISPADVKMGRAHEIELVGAPDEPIGFIHICSSCKATMGNNYSETAEL